MKYEVTLVAVIDFGEGVSVEASLLPRLFEDVADAFNSRASEAQTDLANAEGPSRRRWHVGLEVAQAKP